MFNNINLIEFKTKVDTIIKGFLYIFILLLILYTFITILLILLIILILIIEIKVLSINEGNLILYYYGNKLIGFINGDDNYIKKCMVLPKYQNKGIGKKLISEYLNRYCHGYDYYYFKTSIFMDTFYIYKNYKESKMYTNNYIIYYIYVPITL